MVSFQDESAVDLPSRSLQSRMGNGTSVRMYLTSCEFGNSGHYGVVIENEEAFRSRVSHELCTFVNCPDGNVYFEETEETADLLPM